MEEEERKQKLKAGKEKLAKFQRKKKKKPRGSESDEQLSDVRLHGADNGGLPVDLSGGASPVPFDSELQSLSSFSEDDVSGTEEEPDSRTVLFVKSQLRDKTERVAELEENLVGKQLALDKIIEENQKLQETIAEINKPGAQDNNDNVIPSVQVSQSVSEVSASMIAGSQSTEMSEDQSEILDVNQSAGTQSESSKQTYSIGDVQELIQHVQWLQLQLKQAGTTLQVQAEKQVTTTQALQQAKSDILSLQDNIVTKDAIVSQLAEKLTTISSEYGKLKASVSTTKNVNVPDEQFGAIDSEVNSSDMNVHIESAYIEQINRLTEELEILKERGSFEKQDLIKALTFLKESNENALKENEQLKLKNEEINDTLKAVSIEKTLTDDGLKSATLKLDDLLKEIEQLKHEQVIADREKLVASEEIETLKLSNSSMSQEIQDLTSKIQDTNEGMKQLSVEVNEMRELKENLEEKLEDSKHQIESITIKNGSILNDNESLGAELEIHKSQCQLHENQISEYQLQIEEYENKISEASDAVEENHSLRTQNDELYNKINNQKDVIASLKAETENVMCKNMQLIEQLQDLSSSEALFKHDSDVLQQDKVSLQEELNGLNAILSITQEENTKYKDTVAALKLEIDTLKQELQISYSECERYKITLSEIQSKDQYDSEVKEQYFVKDSACRSESVNLKLSKTPNESPVDEQSALSTCVSADETFMTATDLSRLEASIIVQENRNENTDSSADLYMLDQTDSHPSIVDLQNENEALKKELFRLQAGSVVKSAIEFAEASLQLEKEHSVQLENENYHTSDVRQQSEKQSQCFGESVLPSNGTVSDIVLDDTAYNTYSYEPEQSDTVAPEMVILRERMRNLQQEHNNVQRLLLMKEEECQLLNTELEHFKIKTRSMDNPVFLPENLDTVEPVLNLSTTEGNAAVYLDATEVSDPHRIGASGMEVNLHASSALQTTPGLGNVLYSHEGNIDDHVFQNDVATDKKFDNLSRTESQKGTENQEKRVADLLQEKSELMAILEKERKKLSFASAERDKYEDLSKKYLKDLENQGVVIENMKDTIKDLQNTISLLETEVQNSHHENEKLEWHRDELEFKMCDMEKEIADMKLEKCSVTMKAEQVREELNRVKERLEYLESSEVDIFEMKDVIDSIQLEKEHILKDNEMLKMLVSSKECENQKHLESSELFHQENSQLLENIKLSNEEKLNLQSDIEKMTVDFDSLKLKAEDLEQQISHLSGEMEGLVEENSTLKTKLQSVEAESQNLIFENEKLQAYFPDIDFQEEQLLTLKEKCRGLESHLQEVTINNETMVIEITDLEKKLMCVSNENELLLDKCDELGSIIAELDNEKTDLQGETETIRIRLNQVADENSALLQKKDHEIEALVEENSTLKTAVNNLKEDLKEVREQNKINVENLPSKQVIEELEKTNIQLESENSEYQKKISALEQDLLELVEQVQLYDDTVSEKADLATRLEQEINSLLEENSTLKTKNNSLEHDLYEVTATQNKLKENLKLYETEKSSVQPKQDINKNLLAKLELESKYKAKLQKDIEVLQLENEQNVSKVKCIEEEREKMRKELCLCENEKIESEKYINILETEKNNLLKENKDLKDCVVGLEAKQCEILKQTESLTSELETCQLHLQAVSENRNHVRSQIEILAAEVETLSISRDHTVSSYFSLEKGYNELKHKKEEAESCFFTLENAHMLVKEENDRYRILLENVHEKIEKLDNIISKNDELVSKNDYLCNKVDDMEVQVEDVKKEKAELEKMIGELTNMLHDMQTKYEEVKSEMESTKKKCDKEIKQLQMQLQTMNDDVQELRNMLDIMENEMYDATEEKLILKENLQEQQNQYEEAVERKQKLEEMLSEKHQKDVKNKITVCELMTNRAADAENTSQLTDTGNQEQICEFRQNGYVKSSVSTYTQTEFSIEQTSLEHLLSSNHTDICDISSSQIETSVSALQSTVFSVIDFDKDEDTKGDACEVDTDTIIDKKTYKVNSGLPQSTRTSDFQCQVDIQDEYFSGRLVISEVQTNCFIPSNEYFQSQNFEGQSVEQDANEPLSGNAISLQDINLTYSSLKPAQELTPSIQQAAAYNLPAINIASEMVKNEKKSLFDECNKESDKGNKVLRDQICNETVKEVAFPKAALSSVDMGNQSDSEFKSYECENDASNDLSLNVDLSVISVDSGIFSAVRGMEFDFSSPNSLNGQLKSKDGEDQNTMSSLYRCTSAQTENSDKADHVDLGCQTDSIEPEGTESLRKELEAEFEAKCIEMETEVEQRLNKKLDFREQKVKMQEKNYELKVKQVEYELEEKFEQKFRMREAEIEVQAEFDRKDYEKEINEIANRKIEKIKIEKDKQFVETMQKVRSDVKKKHKAEIAKLKAELQDVSGIGPSGDGIPDGSTQESIIHKLSEENKDLATARDALLRRADSSSLQLQALRLDLQDIMGDEKVAEAPQLANQLLPSWLDWEIAPEFSFGSVNSSIDEKSLSGSLDPTTYCANSNCLSVRTKYEQLVERIKKFLIIRQTDSSMSDTSTPRADVSDNERFEHHGLDLCRETDRFVENTDPEIPMLQRITSIHLEHSVRVPCSESDKIADKSGDQFVIEDVTCVPDINDGILEQIVNESKGLEEGEKSDVKIQKLKKKVVQSKGQIEGHFSENESEGEMENFSESSVTIDYDQFDSYESESGTGVTDKDVHPFNECKFAKSVIRRHMSENELSDDEETSFRKRCFSDSQTPNDRDSQKFVKVMKEKVGCKSEGLFVQELKANTDEASSGLRQASEFESVFDDHFEDSEGISKTEIVPSERVEQFLSVKKEQVSDEQDKFIAEIHVPPVEENPPGSEISIIDDISDNDKTTGEDHGDFFEEVIPVVKRKRGQTLMDLNFKFESYSLDKDELKEEILEAEIVPSKVPESSSSFADDVNKYSQQLAEQSLQHQRRNRLSLSEELKLAFPLESQSIFLDEHEKHDSGDILENLESDERDLSQPVSKERQSYENTIFDVLNSICPGTNPVRLETNEVLNPAIQSCEHATQEFSISQTEELQSQIQSLRSELNNLRDRNENLNEKCRENENTKQLLTELKKENEQLHCRSTETLEELEKVQFLKESLSLQLEKLKTENKSFHQLQLQSQDQIKVLKTENDKYSIELRKLEKTQIKEENLIENNAELVEANRCLLQSVSDLKKKLESQEHDLDNMKGEKDKAVSSKNDLQINLELIKKECESKISEMTVEGEKLKEQILSLVNQYSVIENDKEILQDSVSSLEEINEKTKTEQEELNRQILTFEQNNDSLLKELEDLRVLSKVEKDHLNEKIKTLEKENAELHEKSHKLRLQIDKVNVNTEELIKQLECKICENKCYQGEVEKLKSAIQELNEIIENSNEANMSLCAENRNLHEEILMLKEKSESLRTNETLTSQKLNTYQEKSTGQQCELDRLSMVLISKENQIEVLKENIARYKDKELIVEQENKQSRTEKPLCYDFSDKYTETDEVLELGQTVKGGIAAANGNDVEIRKLKTALDKSKEINEENEWAINELASQVEHLEMEKKDLNSHVESVLNRIEQLQESSRKELDKVISERNSEMQKVKVLTEKLEILSNGTELDYENEQSVVDGMEAAFTKVSSENALLETQLKIKCESTDHVSKELSQRVKSLEKENSDLNVLITYNRETFEKEKTELMEMYSDLKTEVDTLIETKKYLEDELSVLKELLESGDMKEPDISRELTFEDLEDMEELKSSIEHLKRDMKEKDSYVRKLEEHLLNLDGGLPDFFSAPKPTLSLGEPVISKAFSHKRFSFHDFGRQSHSLDRHDYVPVAQTHEQGKHLFGQNAVKTDPVDLDSSTVSESRFLAELDNDNVNPLRSSVQSETESVPLIRDSFETSGKIKSGLKAEEDGHYALELKQFELVDEISKLRQDFRETKAVYEQETALLTEALEREKVKTENLKTNKDHLSGDTSVLNAEKTVTVDLIRARQDIALLRRENNILRIENERWLNRIKEQEQIVLDLRERLTRNTSGIEEIEQVFGKQLALLQKQREELLDRIRAQEQENSTLSITLGEKSIIEDSLRREKEILTAKLHEKSDLEKELFDKQIALEKQKLLQKQLEEVVYQKDLNEMNLMKQKRVLEEELLEIESKFRDREENLGFEKNQLLDELREKHKQAKSEIHESQDDTHSVCSDSSVSDQQIGRLELMLEEVEKQHKRAVKVLRDQLQSKYDRREKALREGHADALKDLHMEQQKQLEVLRGQYDSQLEGLRAELGNIRDRPPDDDTDRGGTGTLQEQYKQIQEKLGQGLAGEQKAQLETLMTDMDKNYQEKVKEMHEQHVDEVENQVKAMRATLEEIYNGQLELARSELDQSHQVALVELRESLDKEHKEEMNRLEQEWNNKFEDLKQDFDRELRESKLEDSLGKEDSQEFISQLNKKLSEEHKQILKKIEEDLEKESAARGWSPRHPHRSHDTQTDYEADDTESVRSAPVTQEEFEHIEEREKVLGKAEDVRKTLDSQYEDIVALRTQMLGEYEQLLSVRTEVMASQTQEVEKLQQEMAAIQRQYEEQMKTFQAKVEAQTEAALKSRLTEEHTKEVEELKQFYESKVSQMEEQLQSLRQDAGGLPSPSEKERDYVRKTTMLTTISDTEETPPPSPTRGSDMYEVKIKSLEDKLKDRDKLIDELKKRLEAETASAEDLHGQLLDSNNKLCEFEDNLKARGEELEELKAVLLVKDTKINTLENEKAEWEEKGEKEIDGKIVGELKYKIKKLEEELSTSKEAESRIRQELNQLNSQHQEAIIALKNEMENINKNKIIELESEFKIKLEQELDKQAKEIANKHIEELDKQKSELENIQKSETELKEKLDYLESSHEKQMNELKEKYEGQLRDSLVTSTVTLNGRESAIEPELVAETKAIPKTAVRESGSPITSKKTSSEAELEKVDRDSIEAAIRAEILVEYEQSINKLKSEYEERISHLNIKLQSYETQGAQQISVIDSESVPSKLESSIREKLRIELAKEYKEKLQNVTEDYESKLKHLQEQIDTKTPLSVSPLSETRDTHVEPSRETVVRSPTEKTPGKIPKEYEGYVSTIRKDYEDKIVALQTEIAQYKTSAVPSPLSPKLKEPDSQTLVKEIKLTADAGLDIDPQTVKLRQEIRETVSAEYETAFENLKSDYEKQLKELSDKVSSLQSESLDDSDIEMKVRTELSEEYDKKLTTLENQCESKLEELTQKLENAMGEKTTAEQKVKADMFVWHEEIVTQLKRKHEDNIAQINKEYEEKMDLLREEMQEEFDGEREKMLRHHKQEIMDYEDRYENLLEGLRTGDAPDVAAIVQEKFDMELEMAKTLIQQECEETIESEQSRLSEQHEYEIEKLLAEKEEALEEQSTKFDKDMADLKNTLLKQYEDQIHEMEARHEEAMTKAKQEFETLVEKAKVEARETAESEKRPEFEADRKTASESEDQEPESAESELVRQLKQELVDKEQEYTAKIEELKAVHEEEITQLMKDLQDKDTECEEKIRELEEKHTAEIAEYQEKVEQLQQDIQKAGADTTGEDTEALELAHQQELQDLEDRLTDKHKKEKDNLETQFKSRLDDIEEKHKLEIERLKNELIQAQQALDQYPDIQEEVMSPVQAVPTSPKAGSPSQPPEEENDKSVSIETDISLGYSDSGSESSSSKSTSISLTPKMKGDTSGVIPEDSDTLSRKKTVKESKDEKETFGDYVKRSRDTRLVRSADEGEKIRRSAKLVKSDSEKDKLQTKSVSRIEAQDKRSELKELSEKDEQTAVQKERLRGTVDAKIDDDDKKQGVRTSDSKPDVTKSIKEVKSIIRSEEKYSASSSISYTSSDEGVPAKKVAKDSKVLRELRARRESQLSQHSDFQSSSGSSQDSSDEHKAVQGRVRAAKREMTIEKPKFSDSSGAKDRTETKPRKLELDKSSSSESADAKLKDKFRTKDSGIEKKASSSSETSDKDTETVKRKSVTCKETKLPETKSSDDSSPDRTSPHSKKSVSGKESDRHTSYSSDFTDESAKDETERKNSDKETKKAADGVREKTATLREELKSSSSESFDTVLDRSQEFSGTTFLKRSKVLSEMRSSSSSSEEDGTPKRISEQRREKPLLKEVKDKTLKVSTSSWGSKSSSDSEKIKSDDAAKVKVKRDSVTGHELDKFKPKTATPASKISSESESPRDLESTATKAKVKRDSITGHVLDESKPKPATTSSKTSSESESSSRDLESDAAKAKVKKDIVTGHVLDKSRPKTVTLSSNSSSESESSRDMESGARKAEKLDAKKRLLARREFHAADSTLGSTRDVSQDDFMVPTHTTSVESAPDSRSTSLKETEAFEAQSTELLTEERNSHYKAPWMILGFSHWRQNKHPGAH